MCIIFFSINVLHINCNCVTCEGLWCCFPTMPLLIFIYSMMWQVICKYEPFLQEVSVVSLILRCPLRPLGILFLFSTNLWRAWTFLLEDSFSSNCAFWRNIYVWWLRGGESTMYILKRIHFSVKRLGYIRGHCTRSSIFFLLHTQPNTARPWARWGRLDFVEIKITSFYNGKK